jgi:hypothetical protein
MCERAAAERAGAACQPTAWRLLRTRRRCILPIGLLFAGTLWLGNAAYLYLTVSFIQMLKVGRRRRTWLAAGLPVGPARPQAGRRAGRCAPPCCWRRPAPALRGG